MGSKPQLVMVQAGNMKVISNKPRKMTVPGGQTLSTKYGVYRAELGPSITGENRYIDCQGVNSIAGSQGGKQGAERDWSY